MNENRTNDGGTDNNTATVQGVGGRQDVTCNPVGGGGGLGDCTTRQLSDRDPRLDEFEKMGLRSHVIELAEKIGVDNFLVLWRALDSDDGFSQDANRLWLRLPRYQQYLKFQRNRFAEMLHSIGYRPKTILAKIKESFGETMTKQNISLILRRHQNRKHD